MNYEEIMKGLQNKQYMPVYFLMGEEAYFIDRITDYISANVLDDSQKSFNQTVLYGRDTDVPGIINTARRFPMMSDIQVVIVKEAQTLKDIDDLIHYVENPLKSTLLVINYKYRKLDKRKKLYKALDKKAVLFESKKLYDDKIPQWISQALKARGKNIDPKAAVILTEFLGNDLGKISGELEKLIIVMNKDENTVTSLHIEQNIGISKDYNNFELNNALSRRNVLKANRIVRYFQSNQRSHPINLTIYTIYSFFSKVLQFHFLKDRSRQNIASTLGVNPFFIKDYEQAAQNFSPTKTVEVISLLREYDLKSKGFGNVSSSPGDLLKELTYKIMH